MLNSVTSSQPLGPAEVSSLQKLSEHTAEQEKFCNQIPSPADVVQVNARAPSNERPRSRNQPGTSIASTRDREKQLEAIVWPVLGEFVGDLPSTPENSEAVDVVGKFQNFANLPQMGNEFNSFVFKTCSVSDT